MLLIQPYKRTSGTANRLAGALEVPLVGPRRTRWRPEPQGQFVLNWGSGKDLGFNYINHPLSVRVAVNKLRTFEVLRTAGVCVPRYTTRRTAAEQWLANGEKVIARTLLKSRGGKGIVVCETGQALPDARLYTVYRPKREEYRVHVWDGHVLHVQQKRRRRGITAGATTYIRNFEGGWVFCIQNVNAPERVLTQAVAAVNALGLTFGAVDVGWTENIQLATVYEVNTAPSLAGTSLERYISKIEEYTHD